MGNRIQRSCIIFSIKFTKIQNKYFREFLIYKQIKISSMIYDRKSIIYNEEFF